MDQRLPLGFHGFIRNYQSRADGYSYSLRVLFLITAHIAFATLALFPASRLEAAPSNNSKKPNIVIIYADDHAQHAISAYGSKINSTPNIDLLASDGMLFTQSFVANSICGPARATLLTGLHSHSNGQCDNRKGFKDDLPTFAKSLQASGYDTAVIGKWHLPTSPNGFDYWALKKGGYYNSGYQTPGGMESTEGHVTDSITEQALNWINGREDKSNPFLVWISHSAAHRTWCPAVRHLHHYSDLQVPEPETLFDNYAGKAAGAASAQMRISRDLFPAYDLKLPVTGKGILDGRAKAMQEALSALQLQAWQAAYGPENRRFEASNPKGEDLTRWKYQRYIKDYLRCVDGLDESVATVQEFLRNNELAEDTIVIYTSDQGFFLGEHGWYDKRWMYEESLRTPLIVSWPGVTEPGSTCAEIVQNIDIAPTLLEMAGVSENHKMDGESLVPLLDSQTPSDWRNAIYYHYQMEEPNNRTSHLVAKHYGIRTDRHKLIYFYETNQWELYDLQSDPSEIRNLENDSSYAITKSALKNQLQELRTSYDDSTGTDFWDNHAEVDD